MLRLEVGEILLILRILCRFFVLRQFSIVLLLRALRLALEDVSYLRGQELPALAHDLRDLSKRQLLPLEFFSHLCCLEISDA